MKVLIDTNLIVDVLAKRDPFYQSSAQILHLSETGQIKGYITANSVTDIVYILRKYVPTRQTVSSVVQNLLTIVDIVGASKKDIVRAFELQFNDYEDALQAQCAQRIKADYIITRNPQDFVNSMIPAVTPQVFLSKI